MMRIRRLLFSELNQLELIGDKHRHRYADLLHYKRTILYIA